MYRIMLEAWKLFEKRLRKNERQWEETRLTDAFIRIPFHIGNNFSGRFELNLFYLKVLSPTKNLLHMGWPRTVATTSRTIILRKMTNSQKQVVSSLSDNSVFKKQCQSASNSGPSGPF